MTADGFAFGRWHTGDPQLLSFMESVYEIVALVRRRLHATLVLVRSSNAMPWPDQLAIIREDNAFRFGKDMLPPDEGAVLWAEFDAEMNRLYAIMNAGKVPDLGD